MSTIELQLDMREVLAVARRLQTQAAPAIRAELETAMNRTLLPAQRFAVEHARRDTGENRRRITTKVDASSNRVTGVLGTNNPYAPEVEAGRKPGTMPPAESLVGWVKRHPGFMGGRKMSDRSRAYALAKLIERRGTKGDHNLQTAFATRTDFARAEFAAVGPRVIQRLIKGGGS